MSLNGGRRVSARDVPSNIVAAALAGDPSDRSVFPFRLELSDLAGPVGVLLLGPRTDRASYSGDERKALDTIMTPLAEGLRATSRRAQRNHEIAGMLTLLDARIDRIEASSAARST